MGRRSTRKTRNPKNVKIRYAVFTEGLVTERQYLELLYQQIRPKHATIKIHAIGGEPSRKHYEKTISTMQSLSSMLTNTSDSMKY